MKIGFTTKLRHRLRSLRTASPYGLCVHMVIPGDISEERVLHDRFAAYRVRGEWFQLSEPITKLIAERSC
ncbi:MAG: GIY-YIG nuclease family protein [Methyloceanibacter sp.]